MRWRLRGFGGVGVGVHGSAKSGRGAASGDRAPPNAGPPERSLRELISDLQHSPRAVVFVGGVAWTEEGERDAKMSCMEAFAARPPVSRHRARALLMLVPALAFVGLLAFGVARRADPPKVGDPAPEFSAPRLDGGGTLSLGDLEGEPVLLNFWASWCAPCEDEAPLLRRAAGDYRGRIEFVGVNIRDARSDAFAFARRYRLDYPLVRDEGGIAPSFGLTGQPETFFIDSSGTIVEHIAGPVAERDLYTLLDVLVARDG